MWSSWGSCSRTCGTGVRGRNRSCHFLDLDCKGDECSGPTHESEVCNQQDCRKIVTISDMNPVSSI